MFEMTIPVLRNLFTKKATRMYPAKVREPFPGSRGNLVIAVQDCIMCRTCEKKCPSQCIRVDKEACSWSVDPFACVYCGVCVDHCPVHCLSMDPVHRAPVQTKSLHIEIRPENGEQEPEPFGQENES